MAPCSGQPLAARQEPPGSRRTRAQRNRGCPGRDCDGVERYGRRTDAGATAAPVATSAGRRDEAQRRIRRLTPVARSSFPRVTPPTGRHVERTGPSTPTEADSGGTSLQTSGDLELFITGCGPGYLTGMLTNTGETAASFLLSIDVAPSRTDDLTRLERTVRDPKSEVAEPLLIPLPDEIASSRCAVAGIEALVG